MTKKEEMAYDITNFALKNKNGEPVGSMELQGLILAEDEQEFAVKLTDFIANVAYKIATTQMPKVMAIQFKEANPENIDDFIFRNFCRADGQFVSNGEFYTHNELYEKIKPFCKGISISIVPKDLGNEDHEEEFNKRFGFINYKVIKFGVDYKDYI